MRNRGAGLALALVLLVGPVADARPARHADLVDALVATVREHHRALETDMPRREEDVRAATASLDRRSVLYAKGLIGRDELAAAARDVSEARARLASARADLTRTSTLIAEIDARRRLARLPSLRPGQYDATDAFLRYAGARRFSTGTMRALERYFVERMGRSLPVSAIGQTAVHERLGLDHREAMDLAVHPDSAEGRLVIGWLRAQDISFLAFRGARTGMATGAHIHVGAPSERLIPPALAVRTRAPVAASRDEAPVPSESAATVSSGASGAGARSTRR